MDFTKYFSANKHNHFQKSVFDIKPIIRNSIRMAINKQNMKKISIVVSVITTAFVINSLLFAQVIKKQNGSKIDSVLTHMTLVLNLNSDQQSKVKEALITHRTSLKGRRAELQNATKETRKNIMLKEWQKLDATFLSIFNDSQKQIYIVKKEEIKSKLKQRANENRRVGEKRNFLDEDVY